MAAKISIIIPTLNEEGIIAETLASMDCGECEVLVVDGGSTDKTVELARKFGATVIDSPPGRGRQLNKGAENARGEILFFLHADTVPPAGFHLLITRTLAQEDVVAGDFRLGIRARGLKYRLLERGIAWRSSLFNLPYGDQGLFMKNKDFRKIKGYPVVEIMEDVGLIRKLRGEGRVVLLSSKVQTSERRWWKKGVMAVTLLNQLLLCGFFLGISPGFLARCYYGRKNI